MAKIRNASFHSNIKVIGSILALTMAHTSDYGVPRHRRWLKKARIGSIVRRWILNMGYLDSETLLLSLL